jgi:uncharacterized membrane protein HdeD (DUF308 family)
LIASYNKKSLQFGVPGLVLLYGGLAFLFVAFPVAVLSVLSGLVLLLIGVAFYVRAKARHWAWVSLAFIPILGLFGLALLIDKSKPRCSRPSA